MSKFGLRIKNFEAGSLYAHNNGAREQYDYKNAMLTNSLFLDFLIENGLKTFHEKTTRDIIGISFSYGTRSYQEEVRHLEKTMEKYSNLGKLDIVEKIYVLIEQFKVHPEKCIKKAKEEIRDIFYQDGVDVKYVTKDKHGNIKKTEIIHYKMLFRSTGKAKKGSCMFIRDELYDKALDFIRMGIQLPDGEASLVEISAYSPLVASTIIGKVKINPKNILIIKDIESFFTTKVVSVETNNNNECIAKEIDNYQVKNTMFDGQALIDSSIFPSDGNGYILLRHHFCKMAAFCSNIQLFFKDYFGENYQTAQIEDMFGNKHYAKDIELITTDNACKWLKFNISYDYWCNKVYENNCMFGIVKTAHESKLGEVQRMSYQMVNSLDVDIIPNIAENSLQYVKKLKNDDDVFLDYLKLLSDSNSFGTDYQVLVALVEQNPEFVRCEYFRERRRKIIENYVINFKNGRVIHNGDNLVIVGSPYAMLLASAGDDTEKDDTFCQENGTMQCFTNRFNNGEYLAGFRSPFNSQANSLPLHNVHHPKMLKYFNFGKQIIAINMNHTDCQDRGNGLDTDSDSIYCTNQKDIVQCVHRYYSEHPTIVNNIPKEKKTYENTLFNFSKIDNALSASQTDIGESSNLAQLSLSYSYNFTEKKYKDYVSILSVLAQVSIDSAKKSFNIDINKEIKRIKKDLSVAKIKYPKFWSVIKPRFNKNNINKDLICPMNTLCELKIDNARFKKNTLPLSYFFVKVEPIENKRKCKKVEDIIQKYSLNLYKALNDDSETEYCIGTFDDLLEDIKKVYISNNYLDLVSFLIDRFFNITKDFNIKQKCNRPLLLNILYEINPKAVLKIFSKNIQI